MKKFWLLFAIVLTLMLTGCIKQVTIPIGKVPTEKFQVVEYINDDAVYQASSSIVVRGKSEPGVIIVVKILDNKNNVQSMAYSDTDLLGTWSIKMQTPSASQEAYAIKISDSTDKYHEIYNNIRFGETMLMLGDDLLTSTIDYEISDEEQYEEEIDYNKMFYIDGKWIQAESRISEFGYQLLQKTYYNYKSWNKNPVAMVFATVDSSNIFEWLSPKIINSRKILKESLINKGKYISDFENIEKNDMSYCYKTRIEPIIGMNFSNIILNQGMKDITDYNNNEFYSTDFSELYFQMLYNFISQIESQFIISDKILIIQAHSSFEENWEILRSIQSNLSNYYNRCEIIPTYDLTFVYDSVNEEIVEPIFDDEIDLNKLEIKGINLDLIIDRVYRVSNNLLTITSLVNCVQIYNEEKEVEQIKLIFDNELSFDQKTDIYGLVFYDKENNLLEDVKYQITDDGIIIDLHKTILVPVENDDESSSDDEIIFEEQEILIEIGRICYAYENFNYFSNLTVGDVVVDPFEIIIK